MNDETAAMSPAPEFRRTLLAEVGRTEVETMKTFALSAPKLGFVIATRAALAFGAGLLVSPKLTAHRRRAVGASLIAFGALTTIPAALAVFRSRQ